MERADPWHPEVEAGHLPGPLDEERQAEIPESSFRPITALL